MKNYFTLLFVLCFVFFANAQSSSSDMTFVKCAKTDGTLGETIKIDKVWNPSKRKIIKVQRQLNILGYQVREDGVYDEHTGKQIELFNKKNNLKCYYGLRKITLKLLRKQCRSIMKNK